MAMISERFTWAIDHLDVNADDRLLEVGCGHGIAVSLLCDMLVSGTVTAIDRSDTMIDLARQRNQACEQAGKVVFHTMALKGANLEPASFDKIFAINVNVFWQKPQAELEAVRLLLKCDGALYIFYQPPTVEKEQYILQTVRRQLQESPFSIEDTVTEAGQSGTMIKIIAKPS